MESPDAQITACTMDCPDACSLVVSKAKDGQYRISGNPKHPVTAGFVCKKVKRHFERLHSPSRLKTPFYKSNGKWHPIDWEAALEICVENIQKLRGNPLAILHIHGEGAKGILKQCSKLFFRRLGATRTKGSLCDAAGFMSYIKDFGSRNNSDIFQLLNARTIVNWGKNPVRSSIHTATILRNARRSGTQVITISPGGGDQEVISDHMIRIRPGTDRLLAAAVLRRFYDEDRVPDALLSRARHAESFRDQIYRYDLETLAAFCDVSKGDIETLFAAYAADAPTATLVGAGLQRYRYGGENVRFINALAYLSGNIGISGGGSYFHHHALRNLNHAWADEPKSWTRSFSKPILAQNILAAVNPPIQMIWVDGTNIVNQAPESGTLLRAFEKVGFKVVVDAFMTDTAQCADLVLPGTLMLETEDITASYFHEYIQHVAAVVVPPDQARSDHWVLSRIGQRLTPPVVLPDAETVFKQALDHPCLDIDLAGLREEKFSRARRPSIAYSDLRFDHKDGKYALPIQIHEASIAPTNFPLRLLSFIRREAMHSQILPEDQAGIPQVGLSPDCPTWVHLNRDAPVYLVSPHGALRVHLTAMAELHPDAVYYPRGDWMRLGGGVNQLITAGQTDMGAGANYYDQYVRLENRL